MTLRLNGSTSGYVEIDAPAVAGAGVLTLPTGVGTLLTAEGGKVLQVVRATDTTDRTTTSTSMVDVTGMSVTITPQKSNSAIIVAALGLFKTALNADTENNGFLQITDSSNNNISGAQNSQMGLVNITRNFFGEFYFPFNMWGYATPATTSAVTYKLRFRASVTPSTVTVRNSASTGQMYAIEVSA